MTINRYYMFLLVTLNAMVGMAQVSFGVTKPVEENGDWVVNITMDNPNEVITSLQFDFTFGSDFSYTTGNYSFSTRARKMKYGKEVETHDLVSGSATNGGAVRMVIYSSDNEPIQGTSGTIVTLRLAGLSTAKVTECNLTNIVASTIVDGEVQQFGFYPQAVIGDSSLTCYDVMDNDVLVLGKLTSAQVDEMNLCLSTNPKVSLVDLSRCTNENLGELALTSSPTIYLANKGQISNKGNIYYKVGKDWGVDAVDVVDGTTDFVSTMDVIAEKGSYTRNFKNTNWQAWYTPFVVPVSTLNGKLQVAKVVSVKEDDENVYFYCKDVTEGYMEANTPYIVKAASTGCRTMTWDNIRVCKMEETAVTFTTSKSAFTFTGNYAVKTDMYANGSYALSGGVLAGASSSAVTLSPYRWFMDYSTISSSRKRCLMVFTNEITGINAIESADAVDAVVYDIEGRRVGIISNGVRIINGKKVLMK